MRPLLAEAELDTLRALVVGRALLAFDFDGTLSPVADHPDRAYVPRDTRVLLERLAQRQPVAVVSRRTRRDVLERIFRAPGVVVVGNHGLEWDAGPHPARRLLSRFCATLRAALDTLDGVAIEDNGASLAVHYRAAEDRDEARRRVLRAIASLDGARAVESRFVVDVLPPGDENKGTALARLRAELGVERVLYATAAESDEHAFLALLDGDVGVRVAPDGRSRARFSLRDPRELETLLARLVEVARETAWQATERREHRAHGAG